MNAVGGVGQGDAARRADVGELPAAELEEPRRPVEVLEPVQPEIGERPTVEERRGRRRDDDLAAVGQRRESRPAVDVDSDVALVRDGRRPGVQADPDANRAAAQLVGAGEGGGGGAVRGRKGDEERVALGIDLDAVVSGEGGAERAPVLRERVGVRGRPERVQEPRRALDVREQERHRPAGQVPHGRPGTRESSRLARGGCVSFFATRYPEPAPRPGPGWVLAPM